MVKKILITGGIGSGKSSVSKILSKLGYCVFDADTFARDVLFYPEIESKIKSIFGKNVFIEKGILNRELMRKIILDNPELKKKLEGILHPAIAEELEKKVQLLNSLSNNAWLFYEASLILETGKKSLFDACIVISTKHEIKLNRLVQSRKLTMDEVNKIMNSQLPDEEKIKQADYVIENSEDIISLENKIYDLIHFLYENFAG